MTSVTIPRAGSRAPSAASFRYRSLSAFTDDSLTWRPSVPLLMPRASYVPSVYQRRSLGRHSQNHERYCLRKSFSMGQLDVGFPNSYVHQIYLEAGGQTDARNARKLVRLLQKKFVKREPERLLRNISEKKLRRLHNCLLPTLCWQIFFCFLAAAVFREDGWFQGWLIRKFVDFAFYFRSSNDYLPYKYFLPPGAENVGPSLSQAWSSLGKFYIPLSIFHMIFVLDHEPDRMNPEILDFLINVKMDYAAYLEAEEQQKPEETLTLTECYRRPRRCQLITLVLILTAAGMLIANIILLSVQCNIAFVEVPWHKQMMSWMDGVMKTYFKERVKYLRGSRKMPKQADDILKFDAMQQSIGCCGIFNYTDWSFIKQPPTFPPEELELFQGSPIDTSENQSVPFACCMWHNEVANKTEPAACNHYLATSTDIHLVGCFDFIFYLTVYVWLGLHLLLLAPPTLLLIPQLSLYMAAFQPANFVRQMKGLVKTVKEKKEDVQDLAEDVKERVDVFACLGKSRISHRFRRKSRTSRMTRRDTFPSLIKWDQGGNNVSNAVNSSVKNDKNPGPLESQCTSPEGNVHVCEVEAEGKLNSHEADRVFQRAECRADAVACSSNEGEGGPSRSRLTHRKSSIPRRRELRSTGVSNDFDEKKHLPRKLPEVTTSRYRKHQRLTKLS